MPSPFRRRTKIGPTLLIALLIAAILIDVADSKTFRRPSQRLPPGARSLNSSKSKPSLDSPSTVVVLAPGTFHLHRLEYVTFLFNGLGSEISAGSMTLAVHRMGRPSKAFFEKTFDLKSAPNTEQIRRTPFQAESQMLSVSMNMTSSGDEYQDMLVPAMLSVKGYSPSFDEFQLSQPVYLTQVDSSGLVIQTDRTFYRPSDKVTLRVMFITGVYRPVVTQVGLLFIETPRGQKLFKWQDISFVDGLFQIIFQLPSEMDTGTFKIVSVVGRQVEQSTFQVHNPKGRFELYVNEMQTAVFGNLETGKFKVCAKYWDGRPVEGDATAIAKYEQNLGEEYSGRLTAGCWNASIDLTQVKIDKGLTPSFSLNATVIEDGTGIQINWTHVVVIHRTPLTFNFLDTSNSRLKAGLPYKSVIAVYKADKSRAANEVVRVCVRAKLESGTISSEDPINACKDFKSEVNGLVYFSVPPITAQVKMLEIRVSAPAYPAVSIDGISVINTPTLSRILGAWYSPTRSYLRIKSKYEPVSCDKEPEFDIFYNRPENATKSLNLHYLVKCQSRLTSGSKQVDFAPSDRFQSHSTFIQKVLKNSGENRNSTFFGVTPDKQGHTRLNIEGLSDQQMYPTCRLLVFYHHEQSKELVGDVIKFSLARNCLKNSVKLSVEQHGHKLVPRQNVTFNVHARGEGSVCAVSVVDEAALKTSKMFQTSLGSHVDRLDTKIKDSFIGEVPARNRKCIRQKSSDQSEVVAAGRSHTTIVDPLPFYDTSDAIREFNSIFMATNEHGLELRPCDNESDAESLTLSQSDNITRGTSEWNEFQAPVADESRLPFVPGSSSFEGYSKNVALGGTSDNHHFESMFKDNWLFDTVVLNDHGNHSLTSPLPYSSTNWVAQVVCIHPVHGLGMSSEVAIKAKQPLFITAILPRSMKRGEQFLAKAIVHSSMAKCSGVRVELDKHNLELFEVDGSVSLSTCVCPGQPTEALFKLRPKFAGRHSIEITATSVNNATCTDGVVSRQREEKIKFKREMNVKLPGTRHEFVLNSYLCPHTVESKNTNNAKKLWNLDIAGKMVQNTARGYITLTGDVFSKYCFELERPILHTPLATQQGQLLKLSRATLASRHNILMNSSLLNVKERQNSQFTLENVYREQSSSQNFDGSFGQFIQKGSVQIDNAMSGISEDSQQSTLATTPLDQIITSSAYSVLSNAREFVDLDNDQIVSTLQYMIKMQDKTTGCILTSSGLKSGQQKQSQVASDSPLVSLTANFLISIKSAPDLLQTIPSRVIDMAFKCLNTNMKDSSNYETALVAFSESLYERWEKSTSLLQVLVSRAAHNQDLGSISWVVDEVTVPFSRYMAIEVVSYYILTAIALDTEPIWRIRSAARHLLRQQNSAGGYFTEKDTLIGMQALSEYTKYELGKSLDSGSIDVAQQVKVTANGRDVVKHQFDGANRFKLFKKRISHFPKSFIVESAGANCVYAQLKIFYNALPGSDLAGDRFKLNVNTKRLPEPKCRTVHLVIELIGGQEDADSDKPYILEVQLLTGFEANLQLLDKLLRSRDDIRKFTVRPDQVTIYFDRLELDKNKLTLELEMFELNKMTELNPAVIRFYDLKQFEVLASGRYSAPEQCDSHMSALDVQKLNSRLVEMTGINKGAMSTIEANMLETAEKYEGRGEWSESERRLSFGD